MSTHDVADGRVVHVTETEECIDIVRCGWEAEGERWKVIYVRSEGVIYEEHKVLKYRRRKKKSHTPGPRRVGVNENRFLFSISNFY